MSLRVGIVEDDSRLREAFAALVDVSGMRCVAACASAEQALEALPNDPPDVVLMDINLPGMSGTECARRLKQARPEVQVVMLTSFDDTESIVASLAAGATGYVLKRAAGAEIIQAVRDVHEGGSPMTGAIARKVVQLMARGDARPEGARSDPAVSELTERERAVLTALSQGLQYKEVADSLGISINTVRKHIKAIYEKLHVNTRHDAVRKAGTLGT